MLQPQKAVYMFSAGHSLTDRERSTESGKSPVAQRNTPICFFFLWSEIISGDVLLGADIFHSMVISFLICSRYKRAHATSS